MDKYEYKLRSDEIKALIAKGEYGEAAVLADTIDWRRVKSVMMLCTISDLYKINRRFEDARDMLLLAYDRHPGGRSIVYSLCELSIKMDDFVAAVEYYKEFVQAAPKDTGRYVLQYKLYEAQDVSLEERIEVLEVLKARDPIEKWVYELAYLYHRVGLATRCVEECDEIIAMFGKGKYVIKAMELKMLHEPLTPEQQDSYDRMRFGAGKAQEPEQEEVPEQEPVQQEDILDAPTKEIPGQEVDIQVKLMKVGQYDTINMQKELAENMKELLEDLPVERRQENVAKAAPESEESQETQYTDEVQTVEINDPAGEDNQDILPDALNMDTGIIDLPDDEPEDELVEPEETKVEEVFFGETGEIDTTSTKILEEMRQEALGKKEVQAEESAPVPEEASMQEAPAAAPVVQEVIDWRAAFRTTGFDKLLGMEYDGQISMVVPDSEKVEKQITGQISLEDVLVEWEKMKKDSEQKRMEAVRQRVIEQTGEMFTEFDAAVRDGLLEQLENSDILPEEPDEVEELEEIEADLTEEEVSEEELPDEEFDGEEVSAEEETAEEAAKTEGEVTAEEEMTEEAAKTEGEVTAEEETAEEAAGTEGEVTVEEETVEKEAEAEEKTIEEETVEEKTQTEEKTEEPEEPEKGKTTEEEAVKEKAEDKKKEKIRPLSPEERQQFGAYIQSKATKEQIIYALDHISMAAYTGNVIITGEEGMDILSLAKSLIQEVKQTDSNFSGKIAKISGDSLNRRGVAPTLEKLKNGALIIQEAGKMSNETIEQMHKALDQDVDGFIVIMEDTKRIMHKLLKKYPFLTERFTIQIHVDAMDNDSLVAYAKKYAQEQEYSIDELGVLALHTCIADKQTSDHSVTVTEVREIMDEAFRRANRKTLGHFFDILLAKRYDEEDMIILREKDFI